LFALSALAAAALESKGFNGPVEGTEVKRELEFFKESAGPDPVFREEEENAELWEGRSSEFKPPNSLDIERGLGFGFDFVKFAESTEMLRSILPIFDFKCGLK
jgi:hypothetical protein